MLKNKENILLELIRTTLVGKCNNPDSLNGLSAKLWREILDLASQQGVLAVCFDAFDSIKAVHGSGYMPDIDNLMEWLGQTSYIESQYEQHLSLAKELCEKWNADGIRTMVFKGLAHSRYYSKPNHREFGDFDCYQFGNFKRGNELARQYGCDVKDDWYKHSKITFRELTVENHQYFTAARSSKQAKALNDYIVSMLGDGSYLAKLDDSCILLPTLEVEGLFMIHHSLTHFLIEGISLRHFVDWACWIKSNQKKIVWQSFYGKCREFKLDGFVDVLNTIAIRYFGIELEDKSIYAESPYAEKVILSALHDDSAIYSRSKGRWYERVHLITNAFRYSWKYREVAHYSMMGYLWSYVKGFVCRSEEE